MFGFTAKITKLRVAVVIIAVLIPLTVIAAVRLAPQKKQLTASGKTAAERIAFLAQFGWQADDSGEEYKTSVIPTEFDDVYTAYNAIQTDQGCDLAPYKGKTVTIYTIKIVNYPENSEYVYASLIVCEDKIIGGDIHSTAVGGFMHGFNLEGTGLGFGQKSS
ncbi:MAG: DUF4830 domain-containing protein [Acutalibacteraceae bacterium]